MNARVFVLVVLLCFLTTLAAPVEKEDLAVSRGVDVAVVYPAATLDDLYQNDVYPVVLSLKDGRYANSELQKRYSAAARKVKDIHHGWVVGYERTSVRGLGLPSQLSTFRLHQGKYPECLLDLAKIQDLRDQISQNAGSELEVRLHLQLEIVTSVISTLENEARRR